MVSHKWLARLWWLSSQGQIFLTSGDYGGTCGFSYQFLEGMNLSPYSLVGSGHPGLLPPCMLGLLRRAQIKTNLWVIYTVVLPTFDREGLFPEGVMGL